MYSTKEEACLEAIDLLAKLFDSNVPRVTEQTLIGWFTYRCTKQRYIPEVHQQQMSIEDRASKFTAEVDEVINSLDKDGKLLCMTRSGWKRTGNIQRITQELQESMSWVQTSHVKRAQELIRN